VRYSEKSEEFAQNNSTTGSCLSPYNYIRLNFV